MALETVFIIILTTATVGHVARESSDLHYTRDTRAEHVSDITRELRAECIAEVKAAFDFENRDAEELVGDIETCYTDDDN